MLSTLSTAGRLLDLFDLAHPEWGVSEIADALGMPKSSVHPYLSTLVQIGILQRGSESRYRVGWRVFSLNHVLLAAGALRAEGRKVLEEVLARTGESVRLVVLDGDHIVYLDRVQGTRAVQVAHDGVPAPFPPYCGSPGKVLLAHRTWGEVESMMNRLGGLRAYTLSTMTTMEGLRLELERVREQGYAYSRGEAIPDVWAVAAPVRDYTAGVIAAIAMVAPEYRFQEHKGQYRDLIVDAARRLSGRLGYVPSRGQTRRSSRAEQ